MYTLLSLFINAPFLNIHISSNSIPTILSFIIVLGILIFVHELGHFWAAKKNNIKVEEFGFGYPPRVFGYKWGETIYSLNWIPFGGFVRMLGQDDFDVNNASKNLKNSRHYENKTVIQRMIVGVAGVTMNFLLAIILFTIIYTIGSYPVIQGTTTHQDGTIEQGIYITQIVEGETADLAGFKPGDIVTHINDTPINNSATFIEYIKTHKTKELTVSILRNNADNGTEITNDNLAEHSENLNIKITPNQETGKIGVGLNNKYEIIKVKYPIHKSFIYAIEDTIHLSYLTIQGLFDLVSGIFTKFEISDEIGGPIMIMQITHEVIQYGFISLLQFIGVLSVTLAIINLLPFPALDGGRLVFLAIEGILKRKLTPKTEAYIHLAGFFILISLMLAITFQDIMRIL